MLFKILLRNCGAFFFLVNPGRVIVVSKLWKFVPQCFVRITLFSPQVGKKGTLDVAQLIRSS